MPDEADLKRLANQMAAELLVVELLAHHYLRFPDVKGAVGWLKISRARGARLPRLSGVVALTNGERPRSSIPHLPGYRPDRFAWGGPRGPHRGRACFVSGGSISGDRT